MSSMNYGWTAPLFGRSPNGTSYSSNLPFSILQTDVRSGRVNPKWKHNVEAGLDAGSPYKRYLINQVTKSQWCNWCYREYVWSVPTARYWWAPHQQTGHMALYRLRNELPWGGVSVSKAMEGRATIAFLNKARTVITPFQALPFLGELKETIEMIKRPLSGLRKANRRYALEARRLNRRLKKTNELLAGLNDSYLEWTFGVKPLLADIEAIYDATKALLVAEPKDTPISVTFHDDVLGVKTSLKFGYVWASYAGDAYASVVRTHTKLQIKGAVRATATHPLIDRAKPLLGIRLEEFVPTVWELLPYSFVADYFANVGMILGAKAVVLQDLSWYWASAKTTKQYTGFSVPVVSTPPPAFVTGLPIHASASSSSFERWKPTLRVSLKRDFEFHMPTVGQWLNVASLGLARTTSAIRNMR